MLKKYLILFISVLVVLFAVQPAAAKTVIKLANAGPDEPDNRTVKAVAIFKHMVEEKTNGEIEVRAYHASKLGDEREALEGIRMGTIQMGTLTSGPVPGFFNQNTGRYGRTQGSDHAKPGPYGHDQGLGSRSHSHSLQ